MMSEERDAIISEDYADLLIRYGEDMSILERFENGIIQIINPLYAVVHIPVQDITNQVILEYGYSAMPSLNGLISHSSLDASGITRIRNVPGFDLRGQGVLIGIIDTGIDYTNPVFQNADGTTRIASIWDQTIQTGSAPQGLFYGTEFTKEQINQALQNEDPLSIVPSMDTNGHGTMVAGIAGGSENIENDFMGVVPEVEFIIVKLKPAKQYLKQFFRVPENTECYQSNDIMTGLGYVQNMSFALGKPIVICLALGSSQGAHDGSDSLSSYLSMIALTPGTAIVIAGGNEGNGRRHYYGEVNPTTGYDIVEVNVGENDKGFTMELWGQAASLFSIDILTPSGEYIPRIAVGTVESREITFVFEQTVINIDYQMVEARSGNQLILLRFEDISPGIWRFNVYERGNLRLGFHIWLPMEGFISENTFFTNSNPYTTILSIGNSETSITSTAYNIEDDSLFLYASRGFTRSDVIKPEISCPGVNIVGPTIDKGFMAFNGTSAAAAHLAGVAAMLLEWGIVRSNLSNMSTMEIKKLLIRGAKRDSEIQYPNRDWGYGSVDVYNVYNSLRAGSIL